MTVREHMTMETVPHKYDFRSNQIGKDSGVYVLIDNLMQSGNVALECKFDTRTEAIRFYQCLYACKKRHQLSIKTYRTDSTVCIVKENRYDNKDM